MIIIVYGFHSYNSELLTPSYLQTHSVRLTDPEFGVVQEALVQHRGGGSRLLDQSGGNESAESGALLCELLEQVEAVQGTALVRHHC